MHTTFVLHRFLACLLACAGLAACAVGAPPARLPLEAPAQWRAPMPDALAHGGSVAELAHWWEQCNDALLADVVAAAQAASPTLAQAAARMAQARAGATGAGSALLPQLDAQAGVSRAPAARQSIGSLPPAQIVHAGQAGLQLQWEIDVLGGARAARRAALARLSGAQAQWHEARVSLAAETAQQYFALRACRAQHAITQADALSRTETARLTADLERAGFAAPATLALAQAGAAQALAQASQIEAQCTAALKALVALTAMDEDDLRRRLSAAAAPQLPLLAVDAVPGHVLAQRPDVYAAAQAVAAASGDVAQAQAQRWPRIGFSGQIARTAFELPHGDVRLYGSTWSVGPLSITLPLFDAGRRRAQAQAARAQYEAAASQYRAAVRNAVREVETALVQLHSARERSVHTGQAASGFARAFAAQQAKYKVGMGSLLELEDARRSLYGIEMAQAALQQQTQWAWVALYRALGGGWSAQANAATDADRALLRAATTQRSASAPSTE